MPINRGVYLDAVRASLFNGRMGAKQAEGQNLIIDEWGNRDRRQLAYVLATTFHETARTMQPIYERGARGYFDKYEPNTKIGKALGNTREGDGFRYRGRGFAQLTGRANYARMGKRIGVDLEGNPDAALKPDIAVKCLIIGMTEGLYTGKKLSNYITPSRADYRNARRVVNGTDRAGLIAGYAEKFEAALVAAEALVAVPKPAPKPVEAVPVSWLDSLDERERKKVVTAVQKDLLGHGYVTVGGIDGLVGDRTRSAVRDFRAANELPLGDHIDETLVEALKRPDAVRPVIAPERADITLEKLQEKGSEIADGAVKGKKSAWAVISSTATAVAVKVADSAGYLVNLPVEGLKYAFDAWGPWLFLTVVGGAGVYYLVQARKVGDARVADHKSGNTSVVHLEGHLD